MGHERLFAWLMPTPQGLARLARVHERRQNTAAPAARAEESRLLLVAHEQAQLFELREPAREPVTDPMSTRHFHSARSSVLAARSDDDRVLVRKGRPRAREAGNKTLDRFLHLVHADARAQQLRHRKTQGFRVAVQSGLEGLSGTAE